MWVMSMPPELPEQKRFCGFQDMPHHLGLKSYRQKSRLDNISNYILTEIKNWMAYDRLGHCMRHGLS